MLSRSSWRTTNQRKVRLLDKLLAKYKSREDHLVQKLSVRYNRIEEGPAHDEHDNFAFTDAVKKSKASSTAVAAVNLAKDRLHSSSHNGVDEEQEWPIKEEKQPDMEAVEEEDGSESGSGILKRFS